MSRNKNFLFLSSILFIILSLLATIIFSTHVKEIQNSLVAVKGILYEDLPDIKPNSFQNDGSLYLVIDVVDGDTIKVEDIGTIRIIGIDTPELKDPRAKVQCYAQEASDRAKELLEGQKVRLEFDETQGSVDKYGRILAYVYKEDGTFFNRLMIEDGYAYEYTYSTPYKYQEIFKEAESLARENQRGLWGVSCSCEKDKELARICIACGLSKRVLSDWDCTEYVKYQPDEMCSLLCDDTANLSGGSLDTETLWSKEYKCDCSKSCSVIETCEEAYYQLIECGCFARDGNADGIPCESLCPLP